MSTVHVYGGLCNRLRAILSRLARDGSLKVVWIPDGEIAHAKWADVFEPIEGLT